MELTSPAFIHNKPIPKKYTCDGENSNPPFVVSEVPPGTKSLALIMDDPDSTHGNFTHWIMWNIPPDTTHILEGVAPKKAAEGGNDFGTIGYGGPCPKTGVHHYRFTLYALDIIPNLNATTQRPDLEQAIASHILDQAQLVSTYQRH